MPSGAGKYHSGFTQLESACISLLETDPGLPDWLNALIRKAQVREAAGMMMSAQVSNPNGKLDGHAIDLIFGLAAALIERCGE